MSVARALRRLDDRVLGPPRAVRPQWRLAARAVVAGVGLALVLGAAVLLAAVAVVVLGRDESAPLAHRVLAWALALAGPLAGTFDLASRPQRAAANYGLAAGCYLLAAALLRLVPGVRRPRRPVRYQARLRDGGYGPASRTRVPRARARR